MKSGIDGTGPATSATAALARGDYRTALAAFEAADLRDLTPSQRLDLAMALAMTGRLSEADDLAQAHLRDLGPDAKAFRVAATCALARQQFGRALGLASAAEQLDDSHTITLLTYTALCRLGALHDARSALARVAEREPGMNLTTMTDLCSLAALMGEEEEAGRILAAAPPIAAPPGPPNFFVAMPKSGGATIAASIGRLLGIPFAGIGMDMADWAGFPAPRLHPVLMQVLADRRAVYLSHAAATPENLRHLLAKHAVLNIHLRDPRDALVSLFEMGERYGALQILRFERCCPGYAQLDRRQRLAALRKRVYPLYLKWLSGWLDIATQAPDRIAFTTYETFCTAPQEMVARIAPLYGVAPEGRVELQTMHFRKGIVGSHRDAMSAVESRAMYDAIPAAARTRFDWQP